MIEKMKVAIEHALETSRLRSQVRNLERGRGDWQSNIVGRSPAMQEVFRVVQKIGQSKATTVLAAVFMVSCLVQSIAFQNQQQGPTTATERMIEEGALPPVAPAPLEGGSLLGEPPAETTTETSTEGGSQTE